MLIFSYRNCYTPLALILCSHLLQFDPFDERSPLQLFQCTLLAFMPLYLLLCANALLIDIVGTFVLLSKHMQCCCCCGCVQKVFRQNMNTFQYQSF